jgi:hypothetical protein
LTEIVNLVIVSDHGMATTSTSRMLQLDDLIDMSLVDHVDGWPLSGLRLKNAERDVPILYEQLLKQAQNSDGFDVYTLETMPERYHFTKNDRIAPLWIVPKTGWAVVQRSDFDLTAALATGIEYAPKGLHGYDHEHPLMRAIFIARGPAFPHAPNSRLPEFQNIEVYNIVCDSLGVVPHPNNGTLRLPLKPQGLHSDTQEPDAEIVTDPVDEHSSEDEKVDQPSQPNSSEVPRPSEEVSNDTASPAPAESLSPSSDNGSATDDIPEESPEAPDDNANDDDENRTNSHWWDFLHEQIEKAKEWAKELVESIKGNKPGGDNPPT